MNHNPLLPFLVEGRVEAGCDEAGRGCLAGPVYAAAVILPPDFSNELLNDSKQLTERQRYALREIILRDATVRKGKLCLTVHNIFSGQVQDVFEFDPRK